MKLKPQDCKRKIKRAKNDNMKEGKLMKERNM